MFHLTISHVFMSLCIDKIVEETRIDAQAWVRVLLGVLVESYQVHGCIRLPLAVVSKNDAERTGLLRLAKPHQQPPLGLPNFRPPLNRRSRARCFPPLGFDTHA